MFVFASIGINTENIRKELTVRLPIRKEGRGERDQSRLGQSSQYISSYIIKG